MADQVSPASRPDDDDYDLLTYAEASARVAELLAAEQDRLATLCRQPDADVQAVATLQRRIALLEANARRYRQQCTASEDFVSRFGIPPASGDGNGAAW
jgi:uncharacterized small protein (DUF1192 family)